MDNQIITERLKKYHLELPEDEENALKEILQEIALFALSTTDFFSKALFQGGTSLRILYQLPRFSEDLDFILRKPNKQFRWEPYIEKIKQTFMLYGIDPEIKDRSKETSTVQKLFLKDNSIGKVLHLNFHHHAKKKLLIKFEIDTNPPLGSHEDRKLLEFPADYSIATQDLPSNFAGKCHALLCRGHLKGRDWFDFSWYIAKKAAINFSFLENAIKQNGPWKDMDIHVTREWLTTAFENKINEIDWEQAKLEIKRFVNLTHAPSIDLWSKPFFLEKLDRLRNYL